MVIAIDYTFLCNRNRLNCQKMSCNRNRLYLTNLIAIDDYFRD